MMVAYLSRVPVALKVVALTKETRKRLVVADSRCGRSGTQGARSGPAVIGETEVRALE